MAFPTIPTLGAGTLLPPTQANTTATRTFPDLSGLTKHSGDLLIAVIACYQSTATSNAAYSGWSAGWTEFCDQSSSAAIAIGAAYKWSDGTETGTISVTEGATITGHAAMFVMAIPGAHASTPPEAGARANGTTSAADPASYTPVNWGAEDTLWIAVGSNGETSGTGTFDGTSAAPTNYSNLASTSISQDITGGVDCAVAFRQLNAASENVGPFTYDLTNARNAALILAVRPSAGSTGDAAFTGTATLAATGNVATFGAAAFTGTATLTAAGVAATSTGAAFTGTATTAATGTVGKSTGAAFTGTATVAATGTVGVSSGAAFTGTATLVATGATTAGLSSGAAQTATATLTATGNVATSAGAAFTGTATRAATGTGATSTGAAFTGTATVAATGTVGKSTGAAFTGTATLTATGTASLGPNSGATFTGTATTAATGIVGKNTGAAHTGTATLIAAGAANLSQTAALQATAALAATGTVATSSGAAFTGTATLTTVVVSAVVADVFDVGGRVIITQTVTSTASAGRPTP